MSLEAWVLVVSVLTLLVDIGIFWILVKEFNYDKIQYEKDEYKRARRKKKFTFDQLTQGEMK